MNSLQTVERAGENPAVIYLASLSSGSRRTMQQALRQMAEILSSQAADEMSLPWWMLRYQHVVTLRQALAEKYSHTTANKMLSALRGVLKACWKLGLMTAEAYQSAASVENVKGQRPVAGRAICWPRGRGFQPGCKRPFLNTTKPSVLIYWYTTRLPSNSACSSRSTPPDKGWKRLSPATTGTSPATRMMELLRATEVRQEVEILIQAIGRADQDRGRLLLYHVTEERLYEAALTVMMRLVFLLTAEERGLLLLDDPLYDQYYTVSTLRAQLRETADLHGEELLERRYDARCSLLATFRAVYGGIHHENLHLLPYGCSLFNPDRFPFLEGRKSLTPGREAAKRRENLGDLA